MGPECDETVGIGLSLSEWKKGVQVCGRAAQSGVAALKNFHNVLAIDFTINSKWKKMPKKQENTTFQNYLQKQKVRPIVPFKVEYKLVFSKHFDTNFS